MRLTTPSSATAEARRTGCGKVAGGAGGGSSQWDAPEIDGNVHVSSRRPLRQGEIVTVKIEQADAYDLHGVVV